MKYLGRFILWLILGALFGTAIGVIARRLGFSDVGGGALAGLVCAPVVIMFLLLADYLDELVFWAIGGAIVGALSLSLIVSLGTRTVQHTNLLAGFTAQNMITGSSVGAVLSTWLGAGGAVFKRGLTGVIGLLLSIIAGGFLGAAVWWLGALIGNWLEYETFTVKFLGLVNTWQWGETIAGVPIAILTGIIATTLLFPPQKEALFKEVGGRTLTRQVK
jgi:hypothetical protein